MKTLRIYGAIYAGFGDIEGVCFAGNLSEAIRTTEEDLTITVNSPGGEIEGMTEIVAALNDYCKKGYDLTITVEALAASAAGYLLLMAPEEATISAYETSMIMYHGASTIVEGGKGAFEDAKNYLESIDEAFRKALNKTDLPKEDIDDCLKEGRQLWLSGEEAYRYGIIDQLYGGDPAEEIEYFEQPKYRAVALFNCPNQEAVKQMRKKAKAEIDDLKKEVIEEVTEEVKEDVKEDAPAPAEEEIKEEVKEVIEETTKADCGEDEKPVADLEKTIDELTKRVEILEQKLIEKEAEVEQEKAKTEALSGGLKASAKMPEAKKSGTFSEAYAEYRKNHPEMSASEAFVACAKANPELHRACIYEKHLF